MKDQVLILPVNSENFQIESYSVDDISLIATSSLDTEFSKQTDYIEYYIFDENQNRISPNQTEELLDYTVRDSHVLLDPKQNLQKEGFEEGNYFITYNFFRKHLNSDLNSKYYIEEISSDRTEIRLNSNTISNEEIKISTEKFISYRDSQTYFIDFYINFGENELIIANNIKLDVVDEDNYSIIIKLYEPLPNNYNIKSQCWVVETVSLPQSYQVQFPIPIFEPNDFEFIAGPNLDLRIKDESGVSSKEHSLETLLNSNITSSNNQIQSLLNNKGLKINVDYSNFSNYIKFSSAKTRLENFYYKVGLIENLNNQINSLSTSIVSDSNLTTEFSSSTSTFKIQIEDIIKNFDPYEQFLYFNSGSKYSYPKSSPSKPYSLYTTGSEEVKSWLGSANPNDSYYGGLALQAYNYDQSNQDYLFWAIPEYLRDDPNNAQYSLFIDMVGQHFDNIWVYTKDVVNKFNADNRLDYGISKDLVADAIKDFGIKLYSNNFNTSDLYEAFLGIDLNGIPFPSTGSELINTQISSSNDTIPLDDVNKRLYKRIYHNIPYLLKTKGTIAGLRALITSYGIPDTILRINEFGGKNKTNKQDWDYKQNVFNYALYLDGTNYFSSSFEPNSNFSPINPQTIQFRFKTPGVPQNHTSQSLFSIDSSGNSLLTLEYMGSGSLSGSYSGSTIDPYNEYGTIKFIPDSSTPALSASLYLPLFDKGWWSVMTSINNNTASLYVANNDTHSLKFSEADHITGISNTSYNNGSTILFPNPNNISLGGKSYLPFTGSIQEIRYYSSSINSKSFQDFVLNPYSYKITNNTTGGLIFRADLGTLSSTSSRESIHPKITGSWETTSSFVNDSTFYISSESFRSNKEFVYLNQPSLGIKNKVNDRISIYENPIPSGDTLSPKRSLQQTSYITQSTIPDADYLEVAFSPTNQIDDDIIAELGHFNLGDYIGDPRHISESRTNYPDLDNLRDQYFLKYTKSYDIRDFIRLIKYFDNSLFKMIKDFTPARTNLSSGVVVKQHILERNAYSPTVVTHKDQTYSGSVKSYARGYNTGSIEVFKGGTGGVFERFNGLEYHISGSNGEGPNNRFGITQSWFDVYPSTGSNSIKYPRDDQREYYNGEFSQSIYLKMQRGKDYKNDDPCYDYLNWENVPELLYRLEYFSGSNNLYRVEDYTPPPIITLKEYFTNYLEDEGDSLNVVDTKHPCLDEATGSIYTNINNINNITVGTTFYSDINATLPWTGSSDSTEKIYGIREKKIIYETLNTSGSDYFSNLVSSSDGVTFYTGSKFTGSYNNTPITYTGFSTYSGYQSGTGATFDITTNSGSITSINVNTTGSGYGLLDSFNFNSSDLGGSRLSNINHILGVLPVDVNNNYGTGSFTLSPNSTTSTTATNQQWQLQFTEAIAGRKKGKLSGLYSINVGEGVKVGDTFTWTSNQINKHIQDTIGAPITSSTDSLLTSITTEPAIGEVGTFSNIGLTGSLNGEGAEATFTSEAGGITSVTVTVTGSGYVKDEIITIPSASLGATSPGGTNTEITLVSSNLDLDYISNGTGDYVFTVPANGINTNNNHLDEDIVVLRLGSNNFNYELEDTRVRYRAFINGSGVVTTLLPCKYNDYFIVRRVDIDSSFDLTIERNDSYSIGDTVEIASEQNNVGGCWEIISTTSIAPDFGPVGGYYITGTCTVPAPTLYDITLKFSLSSTTVCSATPTTYKADSQYLNSATILYQSDGTTPALDGFYSLGPIYRTVNNGSFLPGFTNCGGYSPFSPATIPAYPPDEDP